MTIPQFLAFSIIAVTMGLFVWGRLRFRPGRVAGAAGGNSLRHSASGHGILRLLGRHRHHRRIGAFGERGGERSGIVADGFAASRPI